MAHPAGSVVVVDNEPSNAKYLAEVLGVHGYSCTCFQESLLALAYFAQSNPRPDLLITDLGMPGLNGLDLLKQVQRLVPGMPVILLSGHFEPAQAVEAVQAGAADYLFKPARPDEVLAVVNKHLGSRSQTVSHAVQVALEHFWACYDPDSTSPVNGQLARAAGLFQALGLKRHETMQHSLRVAAYAVRLGQVCGLSPAQLKDLECGALLHDIGKIAIPHNVLLKPGGFTAREWEILHAHPLLGYRLLADLPPMHEAAQIVYSHHERFDGTGYPRGLQGEQIPVGARLFSIVDAVDAITSDRPYRAARDLETAAEEIRRGSGTQFDPSLVQAYLQIPSRELLAIRHQYPDA